VKKAMCVRAEFRWWEVVACPAVITRFPRIVHLAAAMRTWLCGLEASSLFKELQIIVGESLLLTCTCPIPTTALGRAGEVAREAYV
jgi:hypothetical protein